MKKVLFLSLAALLVLILKHLDGAGLPAARRATLPFKVALLAASGPDRELAVPVEGARVEQIADSWHAPRPGGRLHEGQDIFAARGTQVRPAARGYVVRVGESPLGGNTVWVAGAGARSYYYAHLDSYAEGLAVGDYVTEESVLGYVGTTGNAAGAAPHLHFGVYAVGGAIDPLPLLRDGPEEEAPAKARGPRARSLVAGPSPPLQTEGDARPQLVASYRKFFHFINMSAEGPRRVKSSVYAVRGRNGGVRHGRGRGGGPRPGGEIFGNSGLAQVHEVRHPEGARRLLPAPAGEVRAQARLQEVR